MIYLHQIIDMKFIALAISFILVTTGCKKTGNNGPIIQPSNPAMEYIDLGGKAATENVSQHVDLDGDGTRDFSFVTYRIGDPVLKRDIIQFSATSPAERLLLVNTNDDSPIFNHGDLIPEITPGYIWYEVTNIPLSRKIIEDQKPPSWQGRWNNAVHKYLAVKLKKSGLLYNGWFELSMDTVNEKLILYRAAVCKEPGKMVRAGY